MDLTTHCPQCATAFLVSEDQLELAQGWVRCGVCQEVFMAQAHTSAPVVQKHVLAEPLLQRQETVGPDETSVPLDAPPASATSDSTSAPVARPPASPVPTNATYRPASLGVLFILLAMLATQVGLGTYRSLADGQPRLAHWLQSACPPGSCALRQSGALAIDDSSLTAAGANAFHLKAMLSNRSGLTLETPSLALTLTDSADEALARRIYTPNEWAASANVLQGSSTAPIDLWVQWDDPSSTSRVTGYRLQAFYR